MGNHIVMPLDEIEKLLASNKSEEAVKDEIKARLSNKQSYLKKKTNVPKPRETSPITQAEIDKLMEDVGLKKADKKVEENIMSEVLSQDEIDQLLTAISSGSDDGEEYPPKRNKRIKIYDFKRPDVFSKEQLRTMSEGAELYARLMTKYIAEITGDAKVHVCSVDQLTYEEFIRSIPTPTALSEFTIDGNNAVLEIGPAIELELVKHIGVEYGKNEEAYKKLSESKEKKNRDLCDAEREAFVAKVYKPLYTLMRDTLSEYFLIENPKVEIDKRHGFENNPQFAIIMHPCDMVCNVTFECKIGDVEGTINLVFSTNCVHHMINSYNEIEPQAVGPFNFAEIMKTKVPVEVLLGGTSMELNEVKNIGEGTIIELDKLAGEPVDIRVNGKILAQGEVVVIDENFGVRVINTL